MLHKTVSHSEKVVKTVFEYKKHKIINQKIAGFYDKFDHKKAEKLRNCASWLILHHNEDTDEVFLETMTCQLRLCPVCCWRRVNRTFQRVCLITKAPELIGQRFIFLSLTLRNCTAEKLPCQLDLLQKAWNRLMKDARYQFGKVLTGSFRAIEVTYNKTAGTYHPHLHVLASVSPDYFKLSNKDYISHDRLIKLWRWACDLDYDPVVDIRRVRGERERAVSEVAKYTVKLAAIPNAKVCQVLDQALHRRRLTAMTGLFKQADRRIQAEVEEKKAEYQERLREALVNPNIVTVIYQWGIGFRDYRLVKDHLKVTE